MVPLPTRVSAPRPVQGGGDRGVRNLPTRDHRQAAAGAASVQVRVHRVLLEVRVTTMAAATTLRLDWGLQRVRYSVPAPRPSPLIYSYEER